VEDSIKIGESMIGLKQKSPSGFMLLESRYREKVSGKTKRRATETMVIDRRNPSFTRKVHRVEEMNEAGNAVLVHDENELYPSRRRPRTLKQ
jgi:hypothetical protein